MASTTTTRRSEAGLSLRATVTRGANPSQAAKSPAAPPISWPAIAVVGGLVTAVASWILTAGIAVVGWLMADPGTLAQALDVGTRLWLLSNGVSVTLANSAVTLVPWGATALIAFMLSRFAAVTARQVRADQTAGPAAVTAVLVATYLVPVVAVAIWRGEPWHAPEHWAAVIAVLAGASAVGSSRALGGSLTDGWPRWFRALPRAVVSAQLVLFVAGAAVLATGLIAHLDRVSDLHARLDPGIGGGIALLLAQLAVTPNAIVWAAAYALGAGFVLGSGSVVTPAATELGILPGVPLLGALPSVGPGSTAELGWLGAGVLAGAVAAWVAVRSRPAARVDSTSLVGGLAGVLSGLVFVGLAWTVGGDLGTVRLAGLGPRLLPLLVMAGTTLGLAGMITGLVAGLVPRRTGRR
jgi:hypothetical protein